MRSSERGAAQVNILWPIFLLVLLIGVGFSLWVSMSAIEQERAAAAGAASEQAKFEARYDVKAKALQDLSRVVGFYDEATGVLETAPETITERINRLRDGYTGVIGTDVTTLEQVVVRFGEKVNDSGTQLQSKGQSLVDAQAARDTSASDLASITGTKDQEIVSLRTQLSDAQAKAEDDRQALQSQVDGLQAQVDDEQAKVREGQDLIAEIEKKSKKEVEVYAGRISELAKKLEVISEPDQPDGEILSVSHAEKLVYIDLGAQNMLRRGSVFQVLDHGKGGVLRHKGWIEVREVFQNRAKAGITSTTDDLNPIVTGDLIAAPYFDRDLPRRFVLLGRMPAGFDKSFITQRLSTLGASVDESVTAKTDFLILGEKELDEFAVDPTETEEYQKAEKFGVQIMAANDLLSFVKY